MSDKIQATLVGAFVLGAVFLTVFMLLLFGSGELFSSNVEYTVFYNKSVKGLNPGAPVMFRGVRIGQVKSIGMSPNMVAEEENGKETLDWPIRVVLELTPNSLGSKNEWQAKLPESLASMLTSDDPRANVRKLVEHLVLERGLHVRLQTNSLLTGQLFVEMNLYPEDAPASGDIQEKLKKGILPTKLSPIEMLFQTLEDKRIGSQVDNLYIALEQLGQFVQNGDFQTLLDDIRVVAANAREITETGRAGLPELNQRMMALLTHLDSSLGRLDGQLNELLAETRRQVGEVSNETASAAKKVGDASDQLGRLAVNADQTLQTARPQLDEALANLRKSSGKLEETLDYARTAVESLREISGADAENTTNLNAVLLEIDRAAASLGSLADYLQRHPDALLKGR